MELKQYSKLALRTKNDLGKRGDMMHALLLIHSEGGEIADAVKKHVAYGRELDIVHVKEEIGDLMWGINLLIDTLGLDWDDVLNSNIAKLEKRYPNLKFNQDHALNRDKDAERAALEGTESA
jgi:NTP pyrophosphatase (non-canonical NTP hydrolase)